MKLNINTAPLTNANAGRGVGQYTRMLIESIRNHTNIDLVDLQEQADVVHYPFFDLFFLTLPLSKPKPTVVTVHDVIPLLYPQAYPRGLRGSLKLSLQALSLQGAKKIVTDSDCSTSDVVHFLRQPKGKVQTVYLAPHPGYSPASKTDIETVKNIYGLDKPYFLYVGDINYNKNLPELLKNFAQLNGDFLLTIVSQPLTRSNPAAGFLWKEIDALGIEGRLRILNDVPIEPLDNMRALYSGAFWYVQPSLYEGFGLPVLEAQACGCPVISTPGGSLKEICSNSCFNFELISSAPEVDRNQFIQLGYNNIKRFSWKKTAAKMKALYETIL
jgi:glycosyltransferase involved in cell wall biosynthesis